MCGVGEGLSGNVPMVGDWDGDGIETIGFYRPTNQRWSLSNTKPALGGSATFSTTISFGEAGGLPFTGDWLGRGSHLLGSLQAGFVEHENVGLAYTGWLDGGTQFFYGSAGDVPLAGKWVARCANGDLPLLSVGCTILQALPTNTRRPTRTPEPTGTPTPFPLTPYPNCHIVIVAEGGANVRRGPSLDDMRANRIGNQPNQRVTGGPFPVIAYAPDELNADIVWYGFEYSERLGFISWVADKNPENTSVNISQLQGSGCASFLVDLTRKFVISPYSIGGNVLTNLSIALFSTGLHRGFGIRNANDYSSIPFCRHPGFDFPVSANTVVQSIADGVVVGMGDPREPSRKPFQWGANAGKTAEEIVINGEYKAHNLVVRTGGHYILYGHLNSIDTSLYLGKLVRIGDRLGDVADEGLNSHLHLRDSGIFTK